MSAEEPCYLGDGVYASFDGYQIWLSLYQHNNQVVALEPDIWIRLCEYAARLSESRRPKLTNHKPAAWMDRDGELYKMPEIPNWAPPHTLLYSEPPARPWVGLSVEDNQIAVCTEGSFNAGALWAEARLKRKNK